MSTIQTTNPNTFESTTQPKTTPILRVSGADDAPGFAQVLQAFDREETALTQVSDDQPDASAAENEAASTDDTVSDEQGTESDEAQGEPKSSDDSGEQGKQSESEPKPTNDQPTSQDQGTNQDQQSDTKQADQSQQTQPNQTNGVEQSTQQQAAQQSAATNAQTSNQPQSQNQAQQETVGFDLLSNKSDQAKLSIRGLVRAIRADASQDATTIAVQTRLGERPATPIPQTPPVDAANAREPEPTTNAPTKPAFDDSSRNPVDSLSNQAPSSPRGKDQTLLAPNQPVDTSRPVTEQATNQARVDVQHARSTRTEAAVGAQQAKSNIDITRIQPLHAVVRPDAAAKADGALTSRAVTAVDAAAQRSGIENTTQRAEAAPKLAQQGNAELQSKVIAQVQRGLASLMQSKSGEMTLRLTPERLGELKIEIKRDGDRMGIRLTTQTSEARELLNASTDELTHTLRSKGIEIDRVVVEHEGAENDAPDQQSQSHDRRGDQQREHAEHAPNSVIADAGEHVTNEPTDIWTELGLDAIA